MELLIRYSFNVKTTNLQLKHQNFYLNFYLNIKDSFFWKCVNLVIMDIGIRLRMNTRGGFVARSVYYRWLFSPFFRERNGEGFRECVRDKGKQWRWRRRRRMGVISTSCGRIWAVGWDGWRRRFILCGLFLQWPLGFYFKGPFYFLFECWVWKIFFFI